MSLLVRQQWQNEVFALSHTVSQHTAEGGGGRKGRKQSDQSSPIPFSVYPIYQRKHVQTHFASHFLLSLFFSKCQSFCLSSLIAYQNTHCAAVCIHYMLAQFSKPLQHACTLMQHPGLSWRHGVNRAEPRSWWLSHVTRWQMEMCRMWSVFA